MTSSQYADDPTGESSSIAAEVLEVCAGPIGRLRWRGRAVSSAIGKKRVDGPVRVGPLGIVGDEQGDKKNHGGPDKALLLYPSEHYAHWAGELGDLVRPAFGENLSTRGVVEDNLILGSVFTIGTVTVQVSHPRRPCYKLAAAHGVDDLAVRTQESGRIGVYLRVLEPGTLCAGDTLELVEVPSHGVSAARVHRILNVDKADSEGARALLEHPDLLPEGWLRTLRRRAEGVVEAEDQSPRLQGR